MTNQKNNKNTAFFQVLLPLILMITGVGVGVYFLVFNTAASPITIGKSGDIATVYLTFLLIVPVFITIALMVFFIFLTAKTSRTISSASIVIADKVSRVNKVARAISRSAALPFIEINARVSAIKQIFSKKKRNI